MTVLASTYHYARRMDEAAESAARIPRWRIFARAKAERKIGQLAGLYLIALSREKS